MVMILVILMMRRIMVKKKNKPIMLMKMQWIDPVVVSKIDPNLEGT